MRIPQTAENIPHIITDIRRTLFMIASAVKGALFHFCD
jgi:hypothetical protein